VAVSRALRRLLRIRDLEEEQSRIALESAMGGLRRLEQAQAATSGRDRRGRRLVAASIQTGELPDRLAGLEEQRAAERLQPALARRILDAEQVVANRRQDFLARRVERRQAETLVKESEAREAIDADRRSQQGLDDWFRNRRHRVESQSKAVPPPEPKPAPGIIVTPGLSTSSDET
jgi:hypothetical protein